MSEADEVGDLINVQKMEIGYPDVQAPVNYDKKKSRKKYVPQQKKMNNIDDILQLDQNTSQFGFESN